MVSRYTVKVFQKLSKLPKKQRNKHINNWPTKAFCDIRGLCKEICHNKKIPPKTLKKIQKQKKIIRLLSTSQPKKIQKILTQQSGRGIFTAIAGGLLPLIIDQIVKLTS